MKEYLTLNQQIRYSYFNAVIRTRLIFYLVIALLLVLPGLAKAQVLQPGDFSFDNFRKTLALPNESLTLTAENQTFLFENISEEWWSHKTIKITRHPEYYFGSRIKTLPSIVQKQLGLINPWQAFKVNEQVVGFSLDHKNISRALKQKVVPNLNSKSQNAVLEIVDGKVARFQPDIVGRSMDVPKTINRILHALFKNSTTTSPTLVIIKPLRTLAEVNNLGIKELVAHGESDFSGSSRSRITNIRVGSQRFHGVLLKPGQEFSFNKFLGEVTAETGFLPELVIKSSGTVPELGGGLCQVSTTAFRAALYGGLPITERRNHSYAVKYYGPQGTDATIYPGVVDFKFINDTAGYLLIATSMVGDKLFFDFYGTKDERKVAIDGPYQYAFGAGGAMKASMARTVSINGETREDEFFSNYVSQDLFPRVYEYPVAPQGEEAETTEDSAEEGVEESAQ